MVLQPKTHTKDSSQTYLQVSLIQNGNKRRKKKKYNELNEIFKIQVHKMYST